MLFALLKICFVAWLAFRNNVRAKAKGLNGLVWAFVTVVAFFSSLIIGYLIVVFNFCADVLDVEALSSADSTIRMEASQRIVDAITASPLHMFTIEMFALGGYLLVRYILEKKPDKKQPEVHWMDKLGGNN